MGFCCQCQPVIAPKAGCASRLQKALEHFGEAGGEDDALLEVLKVQFVALHERAANIHFWLSTLQ
jgi:hypothetical protein